MEYHEIVFYLLIGLVVFSIIVFVQSSIISTGLPQRVQEELTENLVISLVGGMEDGSKLADIEVITLNDGTYKYRIHVNPRIKVTGSHMGFDVISIIRFKDRSIRAKVCEHDICEDDKFTVKPNKEIKEPRLFAEISSGIRPILDTEADYYDKKLRENMPVLIRKGASAVLVEAFIELSYKPVIDPNEKGIRICRAKFSLRCADEQRYSSYLIDCNPESSGGCKESIEICGGVVTIDIDDNPDGVDNNPDCLNQEMDVKIKYDEEGKKWEPGESVFISFWKDTTCARKVSDFRQLAVLCCKKEDDRYKCDRLGGEFELNAGILKTS